MKKDFLPELLTKKGQIVTIVTERPMKVRKGQDPIAKRSEFQCRIGVEYDNIKKVQEKRETGELPEKNGGLPWGEWVDYPYTITHKDEMYLRCTLLRNMTGKEPVYTRNNEVITKEEAKAASLASEFAPKTDMDIFNIKVSSILEVR